jgi:serine/threonine protein kinase
MADPVNSPASDSQASKRRPDLDPTVVASPGHAADTPHQLGSIGPYRLLAKLGEGGMGQVWLAEQSSPVKRQVALKVIKFG